MRSKGPRLAESHVAIYFPCLQCSNEVVYQLTFGHKGLAEVAKCQKCHYVHTQPEIDKVFRLKLAFPCYTYICPYCHHHGMGKTKFTTIKDSMPMFLVPPGTCPYCFDEEVQQVLDYPPVGRVDQNGYHMEMPKLIVCSSCDRPSRILLDSVQAFQFTPTINENPDLVPMDRIPTHAWNN
jgi:transcription elongation factor Elf1